MEENKRLIEAVVIKTGEKVRVRQAEAGSEYFVTEDNSPYKSEELDFTQRDELLEWLLKPKDDYFKEQQDFMTKMMNNLDPIALEERRAKETEKEYWRNLRGQVFLEMMKSSTFLYSTALQVTDNIIEHLYSQDVKFNKDKSIKVALESSHHVVDIIDSNNIACIYCGNPATSEDIITVKTKDGKILFCDYLNYDYVKGDYPEDNL